MVRVFSKRKETEIDAAGVPYTRTFVDFEGKFWEGPIAPGQTGRHVTKRCEVSHARGRWLGCSNEYAQRHGLVKAVA